eukprot:Skav207622  [mRNA]  locus=scaffold1878:271087:271662:- [translate_table: standard]
MKREGQARIAQSIIRKALGKGKDVIVLGDFNDLDSEVLGPSGEVPTSAVLKMLKDVDNDGRPDLWNALSRVPLPERYTCWYDRNHDRKFQYNNERSLIDHVLVSNSLKDAVVDVGILHKHDPTQVSDHWPLWIRINLTLASNGSSQTSPSLPVQEGLHFVPWALLATCLLLVFLFRRLVRGRPHVELRKEK